MQTSSTYANYLKVQINQLESQDLICTDEQNYRLIKGIGNSLQQLEVMLQHIKNNENCVFVQDPLKRILPDITVVKLDPLECINAQFIAVDNPHSKIVKEMAVNQGLTCYILQRKDIVALQIEDPIEQRNKIISFFTQYQVYVCPNQLLKLLHHIMRPRTTFTHNPNELDVLSKIYKELKTLQQPQLDSDVFVSRLKELAVQLPQFIDQHNFVRKMYMYGGVRYIERQGLYFQRSIYIETHSSKCKLLMPSKCCWILNYQSKKGCPVTEIDDAILRTGIAMGQSLLPLKRKIIIDVSRQQLNELLRSNAHRFERPTDMPNSDGDTISLFHSSNRQIIDKVPLQSAENDKDIPQMIHQSILLKYDIKNPLSIEKASRIFNQYNKELSHNYQVPEINEQTLAKIIRQKQSEECIVCLNRSRDLFTFGCCGCSIGINCYNRLIQQGIVKCPNCRYQIHEFNHGMGAFFLDEFLDYQITEMPELLHNTTIIQQGKIVKKAEISAIDTIQNILIVTGSLFYYHETIESLYKALLTIPEHLKIRLYMIGVQNYIDNFIVAISAQ